VSSRRTRKLVLAVIDGLTPSMLERGVEQGRLPTIAALLQEGTYTTGVAVFPSLTPVCLTSIATGAHADVHHIPHLSWYLRGERRVVEYGSSFPAMRAVGARQSIRDSVFNMSHAHLSNRATTLFEAVEDAGLIPAAVNFTCYRGRTRHAIKLPGLASRNRWYEAAYGPKRFFFFNLFESDVTGAPIAVRSRLDGSIDAYAGAVGRWLVTRDGFDFLVFYLPDHDYASHLAGPQASIDALSRADAAIGQLADAAGGLDELLDRYAVVVCSDHGQTHVSESVRLQGAFEDLDVYPGRRRSGPRGFDIAVTASNRCGMVYRLEKCSLDLRALAERTDGVRGLDVVLFREAEAAVARRSEQELRFWPDNGGWRLEGNADVLAESLYPNGLERSWRALACPNAGDLIVTTSDGFDLVDLGGRSHVGGGSHGSLGVADSTVPVIAAGFDQSPLSERPTLTELAPLALTHFGIEPPASMAAAREPARA
jgi:Type I phosphodiesterase / nucleotide pyrophosphatase